MLGFSNHGLKSGIRFLNMNPVKLRDLSTWRSAVGVVMERSLNQSGSVSSFAKCL